MTYENENDWSGEQEDDGTELDVEMLRDQLASELQAINQNQEHVEMLSDEDAQEVVRGIMSDHKEHVAQLVKLILKLDPDQGEKFEQVGL